MKKLIDGTEVSARSYYYLLDFNDRDEWSLITAMYDQNRLCDLTREQYQRLFEVVTSREFDDLDVNP